MRNTTTVATETNQAQQKPETSTKARRKHNSVIGWIRFFCISAVVLHHATSFYAAENNYGVQQWIIQLLFLLCGATRKWGRSPLLSILKKNGILLVAICLVNVIAIGIVQSGVPPSQPLSWTFEAIVFQGWFILAIVGFIVLTTPLKNGYPFAWIWAPLAFLLVAIIAWSIGIWAPTANNVVAALSKVVVLLYAGLATQLHDLPWPPLRTLEAKSFIWIGMAMFCAGTSSLHAPDALWTRTHIIVDFLALGYAAADWFNDPSVPARSFVLLLLVPAGLIGASIKCAELEPFMYYDPIADPDLRLRFMLGESIFATLAVHLGSGDGSIMPIPNFMLYASYLAFVIHTPFSVIGGRTWAWLCILFCLVVTGVAMHWRNFLALVQTGSFHLPDNKHTEHQDADDTASKSSPPSSSPADRSEDLHQLSPTD